MGRGENKDAHRGWHSRGYLPHFDQAGLVQMITFRLHDSLPKAVWLKIQQEHPDPADHRRVEVVDSFLDDAHGECWLRQPRVAELVQNCLLHFDGGRYRLLAWVVMPNHVHVVIEQACGFELGKVVQSWKSFSAHAVNKLLGRTGRFWQPDYFDRVIRDEKHLQDVVLYVHYNPVKAKLAARMEDWPYSSASQYSQR